MKEIAVRNAMPPFATQQAPPSAERVPVSPELREFIETLLEELDGGAAGDVSLEVREQTLRQAEQRLEQVFVAVFCRALPAQRVRGFMELVARNTPLRERQEYLRRYIPNLAE